MDTTIAALFEERTFITNAGTETYLAFQQKFELPEFCGFLVHENELAWAELERNYLSPILHTAAENNRGLLLETAERNRAGWLSRFRGFRANASMKSHEELDNSPELDRGNVEEFGKQMRDMQERYNLSVIGGCCGTDHEHLAAMTS